MIDLMITVAVLNNARRPERGRAVLRDLGRIAVRADEATDFHGVFVVRTLRGQREIDFMRYEAREGVGCVGFRDRIAGLKVSVEASRSRYR